MNTTKPKRIYRGCRYRWNDPTPIARARLAPNRPWRELSLQELCRVTRKTQREYETDALFQCFGGTVDGIEIDFPKMGLPIGLA